MHISFGCATRWFGIYVPYETTTSLAPPLTVVTAMLATMFPMLHMASLWLMYSVTGNLRLLTPFTFHSQILNCPLF